MNDHSSPFRTHLSWIQARITFLVFLFSLVASTESFSQWGKDQFGNEWIDYNKTYVRLQVKHPGIQRVAVSDLPSQLRSTPPGNWQLWHRGKEVAIIKSNENEILFFGQTNDGASDSLVHQPSSDRLNPYVSLFSDQGYYFLTVATAPTARAVVANPTHSDSHPAITYHIQKDTVLFKTQFSFNTFSPGSDLNHSYYNRSNSWTGPIIIGPNGVSSAQYPKELTVPYTLKRWHKGPDVPKPTVEMLFNGLYNGAHDIEISSGGKLLGKAVFNGWGGEKARFQLSDQDIPQNQSGNFNIRSISTSPYDWYGLSYYTIEYPQSLTMDGASGKIFQLPGLKSTGNYSLAIEKQSPSLDVYDITDPYRIQLIQGISSGNEFKFSIQGSVSSTPTLFALASGAYHSIAADEIQAVELMPAFRYDSKNYPGGRTIDPAAYDYLIITNDTLRAGAVEYAQYRASSEGGSHRVLVMDIKNVYDQFNYGEPSPVAIRNFVKYMLSKGIRQNDHYLFLMGMAITYPPFVQKELPGEVPSLGDPGSDNLLVAGLNGVHSDLQAIPVGRLKAYASNEVRNYLSKVKAYEQESRDISWRKNILHLSGGHSASEITTLKNVLGNLEPWVTDSELGGQVTKVIKTITTVEKTDISGIVNAGVGMMSYFGHGSQSVTDLDFGFATDAARGFRNSGRYPLMYFNGCGVGNIFSSRRIHVLSDDWLLAPEKGAIAIIANSHLSYVTPSAKHINEFYKSLFSDREQKSVGRALQDANMAILNNAPSEFDKVNVHQAVLQGDPALFLVRVPSSDYLVDPDEGIKLQSENPSQSLKNSTRIKVGLAIKNGGKAAPNVTIPVQLVLHFRNGTTKTLNETMDGLINTDTLWVTLEKDEQIELIRAKVNPDEFLDEFSYLNNDSELTINWSEMNDLSYYPSVPLKDLVPPTVTSHFRGSPAKTNATLSSLSDVRIWIQDDRSIPSDTSLVDIYIRPCWSDECDFEPLNFSTVMELLADEDIRKLSVTFEPSGNLSQGNYELMVVARDRAGNTPPSPYRIKFKIEGDETPMVRVTPNPMTSGYVKFEIAGLSAQTESIEYRIYTATGQEVHGETFSKSSLPSEWYWTPLSMPSSGIYLYVVKLHTADGQVKIFRGKVVKPW
jgi:hypothetical protein